MRLSYAEDLRSKKNLATCASKYKTVPLNREAYSRYRLIDVRLRKKPYPHLEELIDYVCENMDKPVSRRTIQLDLQEMRYNQSLNFNAPIVYDTAQKVYRYEDENYSINNLPVSADELHGLDFAISILDQFKHLPAIREFEDAIMKIASTVKTNKEVRGEADYIQFEKPFLINGIEFIEPVLKAISTKRIISFNYQKHGSKTIDKVLMEPYLIREAKNFWYVTGNRVSGKKSEVRTYALDRMSNLQLTNDTFSDEKIDKKNFFKNILGVTIGDGKPEKLVLSFSPLQGKYIKTVPIHHSQKILKETKNELRISLELIVNHELKMQLLSYGDSVKVLQPVPLAVEIRNTARKVAGLYA
jgi:predicted DNA-binding transcriptional regulator YafY